MSKKETKLKLMSDEAHKVSKDTVKDRLSTIRQSIKELKNGRDVKTASLSRRGIKAKIGKPLKKQKELFVEFLKAEKKILKKHLKG